MPTCLSRDSKQLQIPMIGKPTAADEQTASGPDITGYVVSTSRPGREKLPPA